MKVFMRLLADRLKDERGQTWMFLLKLGMAAILVAFIIVQIGPILSNQIKLHDVANDVSDIGVMRFKASRGDMEDVQDSISTALKDQDARLVGLVASYRDDSGKQVISFTARRIARTFLFYHISFLAPYTEAMTTVTVSFDY